MPQAVTSCPPQLCRKIGLAHGAAPNYCLLACTFGPFITGNAMRAGVGLSEPGVQCLRLRCVVVAAFGAIAHFVSRVEASTTQRCGVTRPTAVLHGRHAYSVAACGCGALDQYVCGFCCSAALCSGAPCSISTTCRGIAHLPAHARRSFVRPDVLSWALCAVHVPRAIQLHLLWRRPRRHTGAHSRCLWHGGDERHMLHCAQDGALLRV
jgi:hypothetical protein